MYLSNHHFRYLGKDFHILNPDATDPEERYLPFHVAYEDEEISKKLDHVILVWRARYYIKHPENRIPHDYAMARIKEYWRGMVSYIIQFRLFIHVANSTFSDQRR